MPTVRSVPVTSLFHTDLFRQSAGPEDLESRFYRSGMNGEVFVTRDPEYPGHFGAFFGYMLDPDDVKYPNPYIRDLRVLHDLTHIAYWMENPFPKNGSFAQWTKHIIDAEIYASLMSECFVYFHIPELRGLTFKHEIWVDRFLGAHLGGTARLTPMLEYRIAAARMKAMTTPDPTDIIEIGISQYLKQNRDWCVIWGKPVDDNVSAAPAFRVVESHMAKVYAGEMPLEGHQKWLNQWSGPEGLPFPRQAEAFRPVYEQTGRDAGIYLLKA